MNQRLAAVMSADIADYTRLMDADQAGTLSALKWLRTGNLRTEAANRSGENIKVTGDVLHTELYGVDNAAG
mgnify:CR=1 FL=1